MTYSIPFKTGSPIVIPTETSPKREPSFAKTENSSKVESLKTESIQSKLNTPDLLTSSNLERPKTASSISSTSTLSHDVIG